MSTLSRYFSLACPVPAEKTRTAEAAARTLKKKTRSAKHALNLHKDKVKVAEAAANPLKQTTRTAKDVVETVKQQLKNTTENLLKTNASWRNGPCFI